MTRTAARGFVREDEVVLRGDASVRGLVTKWQDNESETVWVLWDGERKASAMSVEDVLPYNGPETGRTLPPRLAGVGPMRERTRARK